MDKLAVVILNLAAISFLLYFFDYPYRRYRERILRDHLFVVRDRLFIAAEKGTLSFDDRAYVITRQTLNGMIRFAHQISLWKVVAIVLGVRFWSSKEAFEAHSTEYKDAMSAISERGRVAILVALRDAHLGLASHLFYTSLIFFPLVVLGEVLINCFMKTRALYKKIVASKLLKPANHALDWEAFLAGC